MKCGQIKLVAHIRIEICGLVDKDHRNSQQTQFRLSLFGAFHVPYWFHSNSNFQLLQEEKHFCSLVIVVVVVN